MAPVHTADNPLRIVVLVSGGGSTLANLIRAIAQGPLQAVRIVGVISSRQAVKGVEIARAAGLPLEIIRPSDHADPAAFSAALSAAIDGFAPDLVVLGGFLCHWQIPRRWRGRALNIHPALLPAFGGSGMFGVHVHRAVLAAEARESGCTVHLVDEHYDHGPIVAQARVTIDPTDETPETLAERVQMLERELYPRILAEIAARGVHWLDSYAGAEPRSGERV